MRSPTPKRKPDPRYKSSTRLARFDPQALTRRELENELDARKVELETQKEQLRRLRGEVEASVRRYIEVYDAAPVAYLTLDEEGEIIEANLAAAALLGLERNVLIGKPLSAFMRTSEADLFHLFRQEVLLAGATRSCEFTLRRSHRAFVTVRISASPVSRGKGKRACCCMLADVSDLRSMEDARRTAEARARVVIDTVPDAIVSIDNAGRIVSFNPAAERTFGHRREEVIGRPVEILMYGEDHAGYMRRYAAMSDARLTGKSPRIVRGLRKDGTTFPLELSIAEWDAGSERMFTAVLRDVSDREDALRNLRESEERFRLITEHIEDVFYIIDADCTLSYVSPAYERIWGRPPSAIVGQPKAWPSAVHAEDREEVETALAGLRRGDPFDIEYRIVHDDGTTRWIHDRAFAMEGEDGEILHIIGVARERTAERELELELRQAQKVETIGTLASGIAHDFNNVLQIVVGCTALASDDSTSIERARAMMRRARDIALRAGELVHKLTGFVRKDHVKRKALAIDDVLEHAGGLLRPILGEHIRLAIQCGAPDAVILAAEFELEQILLNLASNARDAMPDGGTLTIRSEIVDVDPAASRRRVRIVVSDTGCGIDEATKTRIFEPFFTTKKAGRGTGLGLATVLSLTQQVGGNVRVESEIGRGTSFFIELPVQAILAPASSEERRDVRLEGAVLLVEDEPLLRRTIAQSLAELGFRVLEAEDGEHAIRLFDEHRPDLLVSDVLMPNMTGPKLAEHLRAREPALKILYISGDPRGALDTASFDTRTRFLWKPFSKDDLAHELHDLVADASTAEPPPPANSNDTLPSNVAESTEDEPLDPDDAELRVTVRRLQSNGATSDFVLQSRSRDNFALQLRSLLQIAQIERGTGIWSTMDPEVWIGGGLIGKLPPSGDIARLVRQALDRLVPVTVAAAAVMQS